MKLILCTSSQTLTDLFGLRLFSNFSEYLHLPNRLFSTMKLVPSSKIGKVNLAWAAIIGVGVGLFVLAKISVDKNRVEMMRIKQRIRSQVQREAEESRTQMKAAETKT